MTLSPTSREYYQAVRDRILAALAGGVLTTEEIRRAVIEDYTTVHNQLRNLVNAGLIEGSSGRRGTKVVAKKWRLKKTSAATTSDLLKD